MQRRTLLATLLVATLSMVSCSSGPAAAPDPRPTKTRAPRIDLDPEQYVLDYQENQSDQTAGAPSATVSSSVADDGAGPLPPELPPTIEEDNTFVDPGRNPFVNAGEQQASTFGLDVDTGSFSVGRTFLTEGSLPPPDSIRTEEWINAVGSDQTAPASGDLGVVVDGATVSTPTSTPMPRRRTSSATG